MLTIIRSFCRTFTAIAVVLCFIGSASAANIYTQPRFWGGTYLFIVGTIRLRDERTFAAFNPAPPVFVRPIGPGGNTYAALAIADTIYARGYRTMVQNNDGGCASACAYIWLAGRQVLVQNSGILLFHSCYDL